MLPNDLAIEATLTYQQVKSTSGIGGSMLRSGYTTVEMPTAFFVNIVNPTKEA